MFTNRKKGIARFSRKELRKMILPTGVSENDTINDSACSLQNLQIEFGIHTLRLAVMQHPLYRCLLNYTEKTTYREVINDISYLVTLYNCTYLSNKHPDCGYKPGQLWTGSGLGKSKIIQEVAESIPLNL